MRRFRCTKLFILDSGNFDLAAEVHLSGLGVKRTPEAGVYRYATEVEAETIGDAGIVSRDKLLEILRPYGVEIIITDSSTRLLRQEPQDR